MLIRLDSVLDSWGVVFQDANTMDQTLAQLHPSIQPVTWFTYWTCVQVTALMDLHMCVVVEGDLLTLQEMDYFYWYWEYICASRLWTFTNIRNWRNQLDGIRYCTRREEAEKIVSKAQLLKKAKRKKDLAAMSTELQVAQQTLLEQPPTPVVLTPDELVTRLKSQLCGAMYRLYVALNLMGAKNTSKTSFPFGPDWAGRFEQRFIAFTVIPYLPMMSFEKYRHDTEVVTEKRDPGAIIDVVENAYKNARNYLQDVRQYHKYISEKPDLLYQVMGPHDILPTSSCTQYMKVCIAGSLVVVKARQVLEAQVKQRENGEESESSQPLLNIRCNKSHHVHFLLPELME